MFYAVAAFRTSRQPAEAEAKDLKRNIRREAVLEKDWERLRQECNQAGHNHGKQADAGSF